MDERLDELVEELDARRIDRREFMRRASALGVSTAAIAAALTQVDPAAAQDLPGSAGTSAQDGAGIMQEQGDGSEAIGMLARLSDDLAAAVERAGAGTVTVNARRRMPASGIVWTEEGLIVTANHVVERDEEITVGLP